MLERRASGPCLAVVAVSLAASPLAGCNGAARRDPPAGGEGASASPAKSAPAAGSVSDAEGKTVPGGRLRLVNGCRVLELSGTPEEMGRAHGELLRDDIRRVVRDVLTPDARPERWKRILAGTRVMDRFQPERYRRELRALADASGVDYMTMVALQLFGDAERAGPSDDHLPQVTGDLTDDLLEDAGEGDEAPDHDRSPALPAPGPPSSGTPWRDGRLRRSRTVLHEDDGAGSPIDADPPQQCTNFAVFGPATATGELIAGRNFDYWYEDVARHASLVVHYRPEGKRAFVTLTWAGVINGWTLMNDSGICAANNLAYGRSNSLEGVSTCFLQRLIVEEAGSVEEGIAVARRSARAVGTAMLVAGGTPPDAVELEFDHETLLVRRAHRGFVIADNGSRALGLATPLGAEERATGRYGTLLELVNGNYGRIDRTMNFAAAPGVALSMNLHSAMLFPSDLTFACSMGKVPAYRERFRRFRMTPEGIVSAE